jgi:5'-3' exonuclease
MAVENGMAVAAHGMEADDLLRIWQQECVAAGVDYIICSIDKDLRCIPGRHYLMHKKQFIDVSEEEATRFYYEQLLQGDPTDNIKGIPRVGPVKAQKYLQDCKTEKEFQYTVSEAYQSYFGNEWEQELILNGRLIYLLKSKDDEFTLDGWNLCPYTPYVPPPDITQVPGFEPEKTIPESITKPMGFRSEAYGLNKLTADLKEANDDLEAMIKNGMKPLPKKESIAPIIQQEEATTAVPVPVFSADWGKKK